MNKNKKFEFHFVTITESDIENEVRNLVNEISEEKISEYIFNAEILYKTGGYGHSFGKGYYYEYITKSGLRATEYSSGEWIIGNKCFHYDNGEFIIDEIQKINDNNIKCDELIFPMIKNINSKTLSEELESIKPI